MDTLWFSRLCHSLSSCPFRILTLGSTTLWRSPNSPWKNFCGEKLWTLVHSTDRTSSSLNLCKVGFNHLLIHTGFPHTSQSNFNREEKKEKYQNYCPNGSIICSDQLPVIWFWWKMPCREEFLQEDRIPVVTFWHSGKRNCDYSFLNGQVCGGVSIHSPSRVTLPLSLFQFLKDIWV